MATVRNISPDDLSTQFGEVKADAELEVDDADFVDRAWPKSTWAVVKKPGKDYPVDKDVDDAHVFLSPETVEERAAAAAEEAPADDTAEEKS